MTNFVSDVLGWPPVVWMLRAVLLAVGLMVIFLVGLYVVRFVRPKNLKAMWDAGLPRLKSFGAKGEFFGQKLDLSAELDSDRDEQIRLLGERIESLAEQQVDQLDMILDLSAGLRNIQESYE